jgi:hypothetical protein
MSRATLLPTMIGHFEQSGRRIGIAGMFEKRFYPALKMD